MKKTIVMGLMAVFGVYAAVGGAINCAVGNSYKFCLCNTALNGCHERYCAVWGSPTVLCDTCAFLGIHTECTANPPCGRCIIHCGHNPEIPGPPGPPAVFTGNSAIRVLDPLVGNKLKMGGVSQKLGKQGGTDLDLTAEVLRDPGTLTWEFAGFVFPNGNQGESVEVNTPSSWPADNSFWGEKTVKLTADADTGDTADDAEVEVDVEVFFDPRSPIGQIGPAWYVYYNDTVVDGLSDLAFDPNMVLKSYEGIGYTDEYGAVYIGPNAYDGAPLVAQVVIHEKRHRELLLQVLAAKAAWEDGDPDPDSDGDWVLDSIELGYNLVVGNKDTFNAGSSHGDSQYLAVLVHSNYAPIYHPEKDWAADDENPKWN